MILIELLSLKGHRKRKGLFLCPYCLQKVIRQLTNGLIQKSCGCVRYKLIAESNKGQKRTEETKQKIREKAKGRKPTEETKLLWSKQRSGENNPMYGVHRFGEESPNFGKKLTEEWKQKIRESEIGKIVTEETRQKIREAQSGKHVGKKNHMYGKKGILSPTWQGGISFLPYGIEFNKELKQFILKRDEYKCQCPDCKHLSKRLNVHHIDYDKKNNNPDNLITLCGSCHTKTNGKNKREYFIEFYQNIMKNRFLPA